MRLALDGAFETTPPQAGCRATSRNPRGGARLPLVTLLVGALASAAAAWSLWPTAQPGAVNRFVHLLPDGQVNRRTTRAIVIALSPDGRSLVYNTTQAVSSCGRWTRWNARLIWDRGGMTNPFFSPDGQSIGYFRGLRAETPLGRRRRSGRRGRTTSNPFGATWTLDDTIIFGQADGVFRVPAAGGTPELVIRASRRVNASSAFSCYRTATRCLLTVTTGTWDEGRILVVSLSTGERTVLVEGGSDARFVPTGHLIDALGDALLAVAFDPDRRAVSGRSVPVLQGLLRPVAGSLASGTANYDVAHDGMLAYVEGRSFLPRTLVWLDRKGAKVPTLR